MKNASTKNEWYEIWTGAHDNMDKYLQINSWASEQGKEYNTDLTSARWWTKDGGHLGSNACNLLKGSDGQQFPPGVSDTDTLYVFATDICRSIYLKYVEDVDVDGIKALRFAPPSEAFQVNRTDNLGFCKEIEKNVPWDNCTMETSDPDVLDLSICFANESYTGSCLDGLLDITKCMEEAPVVISNPHFFQVSSFL